MSFDIAKYPTLALVDSTQELRLLPKESLPKLCDELRRYLLDSVSRSSGHFASGLGTVELTVALHYVYNTPFDQLIWDVGHQAYPHKILTGRRDKIGTIRQKGGLHPFPWRGESEYDVLSVGHSSTSISAGIGIAVAAEKEGKNRRTVCVIGDGAITAGMAFEAMNHAGDIRPDMLVVLNDNEMSISENVGALNNHLAQLLSGKLYSSLREGGIKVFSGVPPILELLNRTEEHINGMVVPGSLFEELGFMIEKFEVSTGSGLMAIHPEFKLDGTVMDEACSYACDHGHVFVIDIGKCGSDSWQVPELCNLVKRYPEMKFVACHLLAPSNKDKDRLRWALEQLQLPNLWFDLSSVVHNCRPDEYPYPKAIEFIQLAKEMVGAEKLMFGTDFPSALKEDVYGHYVGYIADSTVFTDQEKEQIFYENAYGVYFNHH